MFSSLIIAVRRILNDKHKCNNFPETTFLEEWKTDGNLGKYTRLYDCH